MADVDTGLGWYADDAWLTNQAVNIGAIKRTLPGNVNTADEYLATIAFGGRAYYKTNNGPAYLFVSTTNRVIVGGYYVNWVLLGTTSDAVAVTGSGASVAQYTIYGETWYRATAYWNWSLTGYNQAAFVDVIPDGTYTEQQYYEMCVDYIGGYPGSRLSANLELGQSVDTGLGWSANSDYLVYTGGMTFVTITAGVWGTRTYTKRADGYAISVFVNSGWEYVGPLTISTDSGYVEQMVNGTTNSFATGTVTYLNRTWYYNSGWWLPSGDVDEVTNVNILPYNAGQLSDIDAIVLDVLATADVVVDSPIFGTIEYDKSTAGYSVTCFCKWKTSIGGDIYFSPVLISSDPNYTLYTRNSATPSVGTTDHSYQGMTFYMRKAPLDILTGEEIIESDYPVVDLTGLPQSEATIFAQIATRSNLHVGYAPADEDPYAGGGTSEPSDGTPDFTEVSESISPGSTFPISFQSTGLCRVYVPSITDLNDLANYLWTDQTFLDTIKNILINQFENFMEAVISLTMVPCQVPKDTAQPVKVMFLSTGLSFPPATQQFVEVDCGYVDITERYASALDYNPYTKVSLYLPFIGTVPLDTDEVMGHRVKCVYTIDIVSGACVAKIMVDYPDTSNGVLYQFSGHCSISMPLTAADFSSYYAAAMSGLKMAAGMAAAGAGAPGLAGALLGEPTAHPSSTTTVTRTTERNAATGRQILSGTESKETSHTPGQASFKELATRASVNTVGAVINSKFSVEHSGGFTGNTGFLGVQAPYVIITRPDMCNPDEYGSYNGRPSMMYLYLGNLSGFTQVQNIKLTGIPATNPELGEIAELLKTGVIL